jgi:hypothetical protein
MSYSGHGMRLSQSILLAMVLMGLLIGCRDSDRGMQYRREILKVESAYMTGSRDSAKLVLIAHVQWLQGNASGIGQADMDLNWLLGMTWVQLASVYEKEGDLQNEEVSLGLAAEYFLKSRRPLFLQDVKHSRKETDDRLRVFLKSIEGADRDSIPVWKR